MNESSTVKKCVTTAATSVVLAAAIAAGLVMPTFCVIAAPVALFAAYRLGSRLGAWFPLPVAAAWFAVGCAIRGVELFNFGGAALTLTLSVPLSLRKRLALIAEIGVAALAAIVGVLGAFGICSAVHGDSFSDSVPKAYLRIDNDPLLSAVEREYYSSLTAESLGYEPYEKGDEEFSGAAKLEYSDFVGRELDGYLLWYLTGFGAFAGGIASLGAAAVGDALGEERKTPVKNLRLGRSYLIVVAAALVIAALSVFEQLRPATVTVFNLFITLPSALCGVTLLYHTCRRPPGKIKIATTVLFWALCALAAFFYDWGLTVLGFIGIADVILNVRKMLDWALS